MPRIVNTINKTGSKSDRFDYLWPKKMRLKSKHYCFGILEKLSQKGEINV